LSLVGVKEIFFPFVDRVAPAFFTEGFFTRIFFLAEVSAFGATALLATLLLFDFFKVDFGVAICSPLQRISA
jgi:hypothetical protein